MPVITSGGGLITSQQIVNGTIVNEDINASAAIVPTKIAGLIGNPGSVIGFLIDNNPPFNVTVDGNTRLFVFGSGLKTSGASSTITFEQNGVVKDTVTAAFGNGTFNLAYSEVPAAGTYTLNYNASTGGYSNFRTLVILVKIA